MCQYFCLSSYFFDQVSAFGSDPPCVDSGNLAKYLNKPEVRKALHIPSFVQDWDICRFDYYLIFHYK